MDNGRLICTASEGNEEDEREKVSESESASYLGVFCLVVWYFFLQKKNALRAYLMPPPL